MFSKICFILNVASKLCDVLNLRNIGKLLGRKSANISYNSRGCIFSRVWPFYKQAVSELDRFMHRPRLLTSHSQKGRTQLKIQPQDYIVALAPKQSTNHSWVQITLQFVDRIQIIQIFGNMEGNKSKLLSLWKNPDFIWTSLILFLFNIKQDQLTIREFSILTQQPHLPIIGDI